MSVQNAVTNSERKCAACPTRWLFRYGLGAERSRYSRPLSIGTAFHEAVDLYWTAVEAQKAGELLPVGLDPVETARRMYDEEIAMHEKVQRDRASGLFDPAAPVSRVSLDEMRADRDSCLDMIRRYMVHWPKSRWKLLSSEQTLTAMARNELGRRSNRTSIAGKLDKIVEIDGGIWVCEHKTSSVALQDWRAKNGYNSQVPTYIWLAKYALDLDIRGVVYDLAYTGKCVMPEDISRNLDGRLSKKGTPSTTLRRFEEAVAASNREHAAIMAAKGKTPDLEPSWYGEVRAELAWRDKHGFWFREEFVEVRMEDMRRVESELYHVGTTIRRWHDRLERMRKSLDAVRKDEFLWRHKLAEILQTLSAEFPRNHNECYAYQRACDYMEPCQSHHADFMTALVPRPNRHGELV